MPVGFGAANGVLPQARLRLVHAHGSSTNNRCANERGRAPLLVNSMTTFMNSCHDGGGQKVSIGANREAYIEWAAKAGGERMR